MLKNLLIWFVIVCLILRKGFSLKLEGYDIGEIANLLNKDTKVIYNTLHRIKYKIKLIMNKDK